MTGVAPKPFFGVGAWELAGALATGIALGKERSKKISQPK